MKHQIYRSLCLLAIGLLAACGKKTEPPQAVVTPTPVASPVTTEPQPQVTPSIQPTPKPTVKSGAPALPPSKPVIATLPKSLYPTPTPVAIPLPADPAKTSVKPDGDKANIKPDPLSKLKAPTDPTRQITPVSIGVAKIGMTFKELKEQIGKGFEFKVKPNFIEGFDAIAVAKSGSVQYYIPYPTGTQFTDSDRIQHLMTDNPNYRTPQGVGPGTPIGTAATVYGSATLSLSKENESREFINFNQHPNGLAFRPKPIRARTFAGDYPESNEEYLKTQKYDQRAAIGQITVSCEDQCDAEPPQASQAPQADAKPADKQDAKPNLQLENPPEFTNREVRPENLAPAATSSVTAPAAKQDSKPASNIESKSVSNPQLQLESQSDLKSQLNINTQSQLSVSDRPELKVETTGGIVDGE